MSARKVTLALLGGGIFVRSDYIPSLRNLTDVISLRAVWSRSEKSATESAELVKEFAPDVLVKWGDEGLKDILEDEGIEAVSVVLAAQIHPLWVCDYTPYHLAVNLASDGEEKPVGTCVSQVQDAFSRYVNLSSEGGKHLLWAVAENFRFEPAINEAARMVKNIGDFIAVEVIVHAPMHKGNMFYSSVTESWRKDFKGGLPLDGGVHFVAATRLITGVGIKSVAAIARHVDSNLAPPDTVATMMQLENGCAGVFLMSFHGALTPEVMWRVLGSKGEVKVEGTREHGENGYKAQFLPVGPDLEPETFFSPVVGVQEALRAFALDLQAYKFEDKDLSTADPRHSVQEAITDVAVIEAIFKSSASIEGFVHVEELNLTR